MDEQLDNDLSNRIREVFDNFDDSSYPSADEGWMKLREKFPEEEKKRPVIWLWWASMAAAVLLFLVIGLWITEKGPQSDITAVKPLKQQTSPADTNQLLATKPPVIKNDHQTSVATAGVTDTNKIANTSKGQESKLAATPTPEVTNNKTPASTSANFAAVQLPSSKTPATGIKSKTDSTKTGVVKPNITQYAAVAPTASSNNASTAVKAKPDSLKTIIAKTTTPKNVTVVAAGSTTVTQQPFKSPKQAPANSMERLFAMEKAQPQKNKEKYTEDKKVRFGVYATTFFNYAKGSNNQVNAGAGFTSDIKLSKNIKLSTGLALAQNTLSYSGGPPPASNVDALAKAPQSLAHYDQQNLFAMNAAFPVLRNYNASLIGLDIPMNIKYEFNPQKSDAYVSAGLSSGTFINEAYTSVYGYTQSAIAAGASKQTTDEVTRKNFSGFYFAKTLNVSFGVGYPVGKNNRLIIEPFLKYPLDGMGSQQIQFGAAGLNLKLNFTSFKK